MSEAKVNEILSLFDTVMKEVSKDREISYMFSLVVGGAIEEDITFRGRSAALNIIRGSMVRFADYAGSNQALGDAAKMVLLVEALDAFMGGWDMGQGPEDGMTMQ